MGLLKSVLVVALFVFGFSLALSPFLRQSVPPIKVAQNDQSIEPSVTTEVSLVITATPPVTSVPPTPTPTPNNNNFNLDYDVKPTAQKAGTVRIPILTYHHIADLPKESRSKPYFVTPKMFEQQLQYLKDKNYHVVTSKEFYEILKSGKNPKQKTVMLTFDDGNKDNYANGYRLLKKYGFPGVFYINTKKLQISAAQLKEMSDNGMSIDSHTASHLDLNKITDQKQLVSEIAGSKSVLENITKKKVYSVSYPGCTYNSNVVNVAVNAGYKFGVTCSKYIDHYPSKSFALSRMHVYNDFENFKKRLSGHWIIP